MSPKQPAISMGTTTSQACITKEGPRTTPAQRKMIDSQHHNVRSNTLMPIKE